MIVDVSGAVEVLERAEVLAYPTETVYGLGAHAASPIALERLRQLKGRDRESGLSVLISGTEALRAAVPELSKAALKVAERFWPGPLTLVLPTSEPALAGVASQHGVGFRCSLQPTAAALARAFGRPLVSTSCNPTGATPCESAEQVRRVFGDALPILGGEKSGGQDPSTVVALDASGSPTLLREGAVPYGSVLEELVIHE